MMKQTPSPVKRLWELTGTHRRAYIPDREAADVVYEIGLYVMDGFGPSQIARKLRERKILTPAAYYESKGIPCNVKKQGDP